MCQYFAEFTDSQGTPQCKKKMATTENYYVKKKKNAILNP